MSQGLAQEPIVAYLQVLVHLHGGLVWDKRIQDPYLDFLDYFF